MLKNSSPGTCWSSHHSSLVSGRDITPAPTIKRLWTVGFTLIRYATVSSVVVQMCCDIDSIFTVFSWGMGCPMTDYISLLLVFHSSHLQLLDWKIYLSVHSSWVNVVITNRYHHCNHKPLSERERKHTESTLRKAIKYTQETQVRKKKLIFWGMKYGWIAMLCTRVHGPRGPPSPTS